MPRGAPLQFDRSFITLDGRVRQANVVYTPDVVDGDVGGCTALVTHVTTTHEFDAALRRPTEILNRTVELAKVGAVELVLATCEVLWTMEMRRRLDGESPARFPLRDGGSSSLSPRGSPADLAASRQMRTTQAPVDLETPMRTALRGIASGCAFRRHRSWKTAF